MHVDTHSYYSFSDSIRDSVGRNKSRKEGVLSAETLWPGSWGRSPSTPACCIISMRRECPSQAVLPLWDLGWVVGAISPSGAEPLKDFTVMGPGAPGLNPAGNLGSSLISSYGCDINTYTLGHFRHLLTCLVYVIWSIWLVLGFLASCWDSLPLSLFLMFCLGRKQWPSC